MKPHKPYSIWIVILMIVTIVGVGMYIGTSITDRMYAAYNKLIEKDLSK